MSNTSIKVKVLMLGESGVGKSSLLVRYTDGKFNNNHVATLGVEFKQKKKTIENKQVTVQVWDTAGQERFKTITPVYYRSVQGVVLVFSITDRESFENIQYWMQNLKDNAKIEEIQIFLVGNKSDLESERQVSKDEAEEIAKSFNIEYYEASAKSDNNVAEIFDNLTVKIIQKMDPNVVAQHAVNNINESQRLKTQTSNKPEKSKGGCCS